MVPPEQTLYLHMMLIVEKQAEDELASPIRKEIINPAVCTDGNPGRTNNCTPVKVL